jgi:TPR repeat protein
MAHAPRPAALAAVLLLCASACAGAEAALRRCEEGSGPACAAAAAGMRRDRPADRARAVALRAKACEAGETRECLRAGFAYAHGLDVRLDPERAGALLERGCKANDFAACNYAGALLVPLPGYLGDGVRALRLFEFACHSGSAAG